MLCVTNVWFCNILAFPECVFITAVGVCFCVASIIVFLSGDRIKNYIISGLLLVCATGVYQQFLCIFTVFVVAVLSVRVLNNGIKRFNELLVFYIKPVIFIVACALVYFISAKIITEALGVEANSRIALSVSSVFENVIYFLTHQHSYLKGRGFFDSEVLTVGFIAVAFVWAVLLLTEWIKNKHTIKTLLLGLSYCAAYASAFLPGLVSTSHAPRAMFALFSVFALFTVGALALSNKNIVRIILCVILVLTLFLNISKSFDVELIQKEQNEADAAVADAVVQQIKDYESETGIKVENISYCTDSVCDISTTSAESAFWVSYAFKNIIQLHSNEEYEYSQMSNEMKNEVFSNKEWDKFVPEEQMIFLGNTLYLCCY